MSFTLGTASYNSGCVNHHLNLTINGSIYPLEFKQLSGIVHDFLNGFDTFNNLQRVKKETLRASSDWVVLEVSLLCIQSLPTLNVGDKIDYSWYVSYGDKICSPAYIQGTTTNKFYNLEHSFGSVGGHHTTGMFLSDPNNCHHTLYVLNKDQARISSLVFHAQEATVKSAILPWLGENVTDSLLKIENWYVQILNIKPAGCLSEPVLLNRGNYGVPTNESFQQKETASFYVSPSSSFSKTLPTQITVDLNHNPKITEIKDVPVEFSLVTDPILESLLDRDGLEYGIRNTKQKEETKEKKVTIDENTKSTFLNFKSQSTWGSVLTKEFYKKFEDADNQQRLDWKKKFGDDGMETRTYHREYIKLKMEFLDGSTSLSDSTNECKHQDTTATLTFFMTLGDHSMWSKSNWKESGFYDNQIYLESIQWSLPVEILQKRANLTSSLRLI